MACCSLKNGFTNISGFVDETKSLSFASNSKACRFMGQDLKVSKSLSLKYKSPLQFTVKAQASICVSKAMRWWEKTNKPNMVEIQSAQQLVDFLVNAGDRLVILDFYSPGCGGCKSLHPKICQLAEQNPDAIILKVNHEELKQMCYSLNVHVLPFFRLYRGSQGFLNGFSCTISTVKKLKDAIAKYGTERDSFIGAAKGLDESEILELASIGEIKLASNYYKVINNNQDPKEALLLNALTV